MTQTLGIIGAGQLGQMMATQAKLMGYEVRSLDPQPQAPARGVSDVFYQAAYDDQSALSLLAQNSQVLTYEFENVSAEALDASLSPGQLPQGTKMLKITQNRQKEKAFLQEAGVPIAEFLAISAGGNLTDYIELIGYPCVLKTNQGGYDGHGQVVIRSQSDIEKAQVLLEVDCVLERLIELDKEISVIISGNGKTYTCFPVAENQHVNNILHVTIAPARVHEELQTQALSIARIIAQKLALSGTLAIEFFVTKQGELLVNELAPRPHNSGHYTIEACNFSQFDTHVLGVFGRPMPVINQHSPAIMINVLGQHYEAAKDLEGQDAYANWHFHDYGKKEAKHNRKMGHITLLTQDVESSLAELTALGIW